MQWPHLSASDDLRSPQIVRGFVGGMAVCPLSYWSQAPRTPWCPEYVMTLLICALSHRCMHGRCIRGERLKETRLEGVPMLRKRKHTALYNSHTLAVSVGTKYGVPLTPSIARDKFW